MKITQALSVSFLLVGLLASVSSRADAWDDRIWEGQGSFTDNVSGVRACEQLDLWILRKDQRLEVYYKGLCDTEAWTDSLSFDVGPDQSLWLDGEKVGSISDQEISYVLVQPDEDYLYEGSFRLQSDGTVTVHDHVTQNFYESRVDATLGLGFSLGR
jgi:hypothetical protein